MTTKLYLDTRSSSGNTDTPCSVKVAISAHGSTLYINTGIRILASEWDKKTGKVCAGPLKARYNVALQEKKLKVDRVLDSLAEEGALRGKTLSEIRKMILSRLEPQTAGQRTDNLVIPRVLAYAERAKRPATAVSYRLTARKIQAYDRCPDRLTFEDIDRRWLEGFDAWMARTAPSANARNIHLRNLRTVFNAAIDDRLTDAYPFRKFRIRPEPTKDRSLPVGTLRAIFSCECEPYQEEYRDIFKLIFLLCGINMGDLAGLRGIRNGRIEYRRLKTGQPVSVAVPPEAIEIIDKYRGEEHLLNISERCPDYTTYLHRLNDGLKKLGTRYNPRTKQTDGVPICADISTYYARYSWATIATELDIPERTIAAALGHSTASVTDIYIRTNMRRKVDDANRRIIDYVFRDEDTRP